MQDFFFSGCCFHSRIGARIERFEKKRAPAREIHVNLIITSLMIFWGLVSERANFFFYFYSRGETDAMIGRGSWNARGKLKKVGMLQWERFKG